MKPRLLVLAWLLALANCLVHPAIAGETPTADKAAVASSTPPAAEDANTSPPSPDGETTRRDDDRGSFEATIVTGDRSRQFDSPARTMTELQRAAGLKRRAGKDQGLSFKAVVVVNGDAYEFTDPDDARTALRALMDAVRRLAKVRADLGDLGTIPEADPADDADDEAPARDNRQTAMLTIRQRVNEALRQEMQRNQGRMPTPQRVHQIYLEQLNRARSEGLLPEAPADPGAARLPAGAALEARKAAEIEALREMLARAFSPAARDDDEPAVAPAGGEK